jgi:hypothetical protein
MYTFFENDSCILKIYICTVCLFQKSNLPHKQKIFNFLNKKFLSEKVDIFGVNRENLQL